MMKSLLRRKQAQGIAALVVAIAVLAMVVGLGLSNGIARAVPPPTTNKITVDPVAHLLSNGGVNIGFHYECSTASEAAEIDVDLDQGGFHSFRTISKLVCNGHLNTTSVIVSPPTGVTFTRGTATVTALIIEAGGAQIAMTKETVKIV